MSAGDNSETEILGGDEPQNVCSNIFIGGSSVSRKTLDFTEQCGEMFGTDPELRPAEVSVVGGGSVPFRFLKGILAKKSRPHPHSIQIIGDNEEKWIQFIQKLNGKYANGPQICSAEMLALVKKNIAKLDGAIIIGEDGMARDLAMIALMHSKKVLVGGTGPDFEVSREILCQDAGDSAKGNLLFFNQPEMCAAIVKKEIGVTLPLRIKIHKMKKK